MSSGLQDEQPDRTGLPADVKQQIIARSTPSLDGLVDEPLRVEVVRRVIESLPIAPAVAQQVQVTATQHTGPVPAPETMGGYEQVLPGSADRMFRMAERDQEAMIASNKREQLIDGVFRIGSLVAGVIGLGAVLSVIVHLAEHGHENVAIAVSALGIGGVVGAFVNARMNKTP